MAEPSNKPRDIKNLKARLGRTITPGQVGGSMPPLGSAPPVPGGSLPPPNLRGSVPPPTLGSPMGNPLGSPMGNPLGGPGMGGMPRNNSVPTPAFAQPRPAPSAPMGMGMPAAGAPAPRAAAASPFDIAAPVAVAERKVRLVIDDSAVKEDEIGRKSTMRNIVLVVIGAALGLTVGYMVASTAADRNQFKMALADTKDIYSRVTETGKTVEAAKSNLKKAVEASQGGPGKVASVDYAAIGELLKLKHPFPADEFSRRRYLAFPTGTVDALFEYYNNINLLWKKFELLGTQTTGDTKHKALDKAAAAAEQLMASEYGVVLSKNGDMMAGAVVIVKPKPAEDAAPADKKKDKEEDTAPKVMVSSREGGKEVERTLYVGQEDFAEKYDQYVMMVDKGRSMAQLGGAANLFGELRGNLMETQALMDRTMELQGRLVKELGQIAALQE
jgi:hypothetical protein